MRQESARQSLCAQAHGGKSGLHRARCQVTPGRREPTESATERYRLSAAQAAPVRVKWCGKSAPRGWQHQRHGKPHLEQDQIGKRAAQKAATCGPHGLPGRSLEPRGDACARGMTVHDRTRLIDRLFSSTITRSAAAERVISCVPGAEFRSNPLPIDSEWHLLPIRHSLLYFYSIKKEYLSTSKPCS